jgi:hypothetical protein
MGWRVKVKVGKRTLYSHSYSSEAKAKRAKKRIRGARGVVKS